MYLPNAICTSISEEENLALMEMPSGMEIRKATFSIDRNSAPSPDGFNAAFYQSYWHLLSPDIVRMVHAFFSTGHLDSKTNASNLILIHKKEGANKLEDFRPISLCNVRYKIISKLLVNRIRPLLWKCISEM
ncbi:hypothetical protein AAC387_Pa01g1625 [Persea americana]